MEPWVQHGSQVPYISQEMIFTIRSTCWELKIEKLSHWARSVVPWRWTPFTYQLCYGITELMIRTLLLPSVHERWI